MSPRKWAVTIAVPVLVCCLAAAGCQGTRGEGTVEQAAPEPSKAEFEHRGNADAPIKVEAYYPLNESHQFIVDYLFEFAEAHPDQVYVEVVDMQTPEGRKRWQDTGLSCAGVFINGKTQHQITIEGKTETVDFIKRMGVFWTSEDFEAVVKQLLEAAGKADEPETERSAASED